MTQEEDKHTVTLSAQEFDSATRRSNSNSIYMTNYLTIVITV